MDRQLGIDEIRLLNKKNWQDWHYQAIQQISGKWSSMQWRSACTPANINKVEDLALSQENKPMKQFTLEQCVMD